MGGASPTYQWKINGIAVGGGTGPTFTWSSFVDNDTISCSVTSSGICAGIATTVKEVMKVQSVGIAETGIHTGKLTLQPNPNTGAFTIKGKLNTLGNTPVKLQVTDVLGQVVYEKEITAKGGVMNEPVSISNALSNGMYILNLRSGEENYIFHFVVRK